MTSYGVMCMAHMLVTEPTSNCMHKYMPPIERLCAVEASIIVHAANSSSYPAGKPEIASLFGTSI
jgi:hypothetical protein